MSHFERVERTEMRDWSIARSTTVDPSNRRSIDPSILIEQIKQFHWNASLAIDKYSHFVNKWRQRLTGSRENVRRFRCSIIYIILLANEMPLPLAWCDGAQWGAVGRDGSLFSFLLSLIDFHERFPPKSKHHRYELIVRKSCPGNAHRIRRFVGHLLTGPMAPAALHPALHKNQCLSTWAANNDPRSRLKNTHRSFDSFIGALRIAFQSIFTPENQRNEFSLSSPLNSLEFSSPAAMAPTFLTFWALQLRMLFCSVAHLLS